jgi:diguanylate cyclase (GGDEF)-like protein
MGAHSRAVRMAVMAALGLCAAWLVINELRIVVLPHLPLGALSARGAHIVVLAVSAALCLMRASIRREARVAWLLIAAGMFAWTFGEVYYTLVLWTQAHPPVPSPADAGYLLFPPLALAGLIVLVRQRTSELPRVLWADGLTTALAAGAVSAAIVFQEVLRHDSGTPLAVATSLAYPTMDLILLATVLGALSRMGWRVDRMWVLLACGILLLGLADSLYLVAVAKGTYQEGSWFDDGWWAGFFLIACAAYQPNPTVLAPRVDDSHRLIAVPLLFGCLALSLLVYGCFRPITGLAVGLAAASLLGVMVRLLLTFRENIAMLRATRGEALSDPLTGLGNRRALTRRLEALVSRDSDQMLLVLFDLDGFKAYNDAYGHAAGDALLVRLARKLTDHLGLSGEAFRMGGDEFCALMAIEQSDPHTQVKHAAAALTEQGEGFVIGCSYGFISLPAEAATAPEALRLADQRMYARKNSGRASAGGQVRDALLKLASESNSDFDHRARFVADLARAISRQMDLPDADISDICRAAELHDIGKLAIPTAILHQHDPLEEADRAYVHRYTTVGERIIAAAPALASVAKLVRHSQERWDGNGYPDRLAGTAIPTGARIIAVADAFYALTHSRPHAPAMSPEAARAILHQEAGTQFDPRVVGALTAALTERVPA